MIMPELSEKGAAILTRYVQELTRLYLQKNSDDFPLDMSDRSKGHRWVLIVGMPNMHYQFYFSSKEELLGRIKAYAHILGLTKITVEDGVELTL